MPLEINIGLFPEEEVLADFRVQQLAPEFFRVFTISTKDIDLPKVEDNILDISRLLIRRGTKRFVLVKRELIRKRTTLSYISYIALYSSGQLYIVTKVLITQAKSFIIIYQIQASRSSTSSQLEIALEVVVQVQVLLPKSRQGRGLILRSFYLFVVRLRLEGDQGSYGCIQSVF